MEEAFFYDYEKIEDSEEVQPVIKVLHCVPAMERNKIRLYQMGNTFKAVYRPATLSKGVSARAVSEFNRASGWTEANRKRILHNRQEYHPDSGETDEEKSEKAKAAAVSRSKRFVRELAACNPWRYFVTITLSPILWDRDNPEKLQDTIAELAKRWRRKSKKHPAQCPGFAYLFVPECHENGAIHLHGLVNAVPEADLIAYTLDEVNSGKPLPRYICESLKKGKQLFHCAEWDTIFGYNLLEPVDNIDRVASYVTKYISKDLGRTPFNCSYWCSRGLQRASLVSVCTISGERKSVQRKLHAYEEMMFKMAATAKNGQKLHKWNYIEDDDGAASCEKLASIVTYVNAEEHNKEEIMAFFEDLLKEETEETDE